MREFGVCLFFKFSFWLGTTKKISVKKISLYSEPVGLPTLLHKHKQTGGKKASVFIFVWLQEWTCYDTPNLIKWLIKVERLVTLHLSKSFRKLSLKKKKKSSSLYQQLCYSVFLPDNFTTSKQKWGQQDLLFLLGNQVPPSSVQSAGLSGLEQGLTKPARRGCSVKSPGEFAIAALHYKFWPLPFLKQKGKWLRTANSCLSAKLPWNAEYRLKSNILGAAVITERLSL